MMKAYHGSTELKQRAINSMKVHIQQDRLVNGQYWNGSGGCHIGCVVMELCSSTPLRWHTAYEQVLGVPRDLAILFDTLFEALEERQQFSLDILEAIPVGADLSAVVRQLHIWLLNDIRQYAEVSIINTAISLLVENCQDKGRWQQVKSMARAIVYNDCLISRNAAQVVMWVAEGAVAGNSVDAATDLAAWSAACTAASWEKESDARFAAWTAARNIQATVLLELLRSAPCAEGADNSENSNA